MLQPQFNFLHLQELKIPSETLSECQTAWIQIRFDIDPDLGPNCLQRLSADDKSRH